MSDASDTLSRQLTDVTQTDNPPGGLRSDRTTSLERARTGAAVLGFALPLCAYFWLINHYGANLLWHDQWDDINLISHSYSHTLSLNTLWAQHNENRIFFPNLIVLILARTSQFNVLLEEYLGGLMLVFATGLLIVAHRRRSPSTPWIYYCPIAFIMLSFVQYPNALWGFQMAWYLVIAAFALALFLSGQAGPQLARAGRSDRRGGGRQLFLAAGASHLACGSGAPLLPESPKKSGRRLDRVRRGDRGLVSLPLQVWRRR